MHIYQTMCTRGMRETYLYICDLKLREYLSKYIDEYNYSGITYKMDEKEDGNILMVAEDNEEYKYD